MTMRITMTQARMGEAGSILAAGSTYTVGDAFGAAMVGAGYATDTDAALRPPASALSQSQVTAVQALVSDDGIQAPSTAPSAAVGSAGALTGAYYYSVLFRTALGLTAPWPGTATAVNPVSQQVNLTAIPIGPSGVIARVIVRTPATPVDPKDYRSLAEITDNTTTTYTDNIADGSLGPPVDWAAENRGNFRDGSASRFAVFSDQSTAMGQGTFGTNTGYASSAFGFAALASNTTGRRNAAFGVYALTSLTEGFENTAMGVHAGQFLATGDGNTFFGYCAGFYSNGVCNFNTAYGVQALYGTAAGLGSSNTAMGYRALYQIPALDNCIGIGSYAGQFANNNRQLFIDPHAVTRANLAAAQDSGLIYGKGESTPQTQDLRLNAPTRVGWGAGTVAQLPAAVAGLKGYRAWVGDASLAYTSANLGSTVAGGGANCVPVFCTGTAWVIG